MLRQLLFVCMALIMLTNSACASSLVNVKLHVVDNDNKPVADTNIVMVFLLSQGGNIARGTTDSEGYIEASENGIFGVGISVTKEGYYLSKYRTGYGDQDLTVVLREKKNPIAMYAKSTSFALDEPIHNVWLGYDLEKGDFLPPKSMGSESLIFVL
jgi:hypothetical protein